LQKFSNKGAAARRPEPSGVSRARGARLGKVSIFKDLGEAPGMS